ncbi:hypothetical protein DFH08DRAFT_825428 [Mycena albidolilacea]|uniref:Uncharacterized protein n=1 Tax=Mycena albidolilacea TaxID=1033008 RepID=A0AAD6Z2J9_9AGAR|nr:hypothetical protein DFH08DRAFT_825428 [Mycena albidolilacea]
MTLVWFGFNKPWFWFAGFLVSNQTKNITTWHKNPVTQTQRKPLKMVLSLPPHRHVALRGEEQQDKDKTFSFSDDGYNDTPSRHPLLPPLFKICPPCPMLAVQEVQPRRLFGVRNAHACGMNLLIGSTIRMATSSASAHCRGNGACVCSWSDVEMPDAVSAQRGHGHNSEAFENIVRNTTMQRQ